VFLFIGVFDCGRIEGRGEEGGGFYVENEEPALKLLEWSLDAVDEIARLREELDSRLLQHSRDRVNCEKRVASSSR
jgi:hypothetical protein